MITIATSDPRYRQGKGPKAKVRDVMTEDVKDCFDDQELDEVTRNMAGIQVRRLPVLNRDKRLVGILSLATSPSAGTAKSRRSVAWGFRVRAENTPRRADITRVTPCWISPILASEPDGRCSDRPARGARSARADAMRHVHVKPSSSPVLRSSPTKTVHADRRRPDDLATIYRRADVSTRPR